jgi:hypothetical protein
MDAIDLKLTDAAKKKLLRDLAAIADFEPIVSVVWSERGEVWVEKDGKKEKVRELPPHSGVGFNEIEKIPPDYHQLIDGIIFYFDQGKISERLNGKTLDVSEGCYVVRDELLSNLVFSRVNQAAAWSTAVASIPSLNLTPVITLAR